MNKVIQRLNAQDLLTLRAIVEATREGQVSQAAYESARRWHDLRDKLDMVLNTLQQAGDPIPSRS